MKQKEDFNEKWFNSWNKIKKVIPHYTDIFDMSSDEGCDKSLDRVIDWIDIVFENDDVIRIKAEDYNSDILQDRLGEDHQLCPHLKLLVSEFKEVKP